MADTITDARVIKQTNEKLRPTADAVVIAYKTMMTLIQEALTPDPMGKTLMDSIPNDLTTISDGSGPDGDGREILYGSDWHKILASAQALVTGAQEGDALPVWLRACVNGNSKF